MTPKRHNYSIRGKYVLNIINKCEIVFAHWSGNETMMSAHSPACLATFFPTNCNTHHYTISNGPGKKTQLFWR